MQPAETKPSTLAAKILEVMKVVDRIEKDKRNDFHNYKYASEDAVVTALREAFIAQKIICTPSQKSCVAMKKTTAKGESAITSVEVEFTLEDVETGEKRLATFWGQGEDASDKGVYKAATGAEKYYLLKTFLIPTGDDPENDRSANGGGRGGTYRRPVDPAAQRPAAASTAPAKPAAATPPANAAPANATPANAAPAPAAAAAPAAAKPAPGIEAIRVVLVGVKKYTKAPAQEGGKETVYFKLMDSEGANYTTFSESVAKAADTFAKTKTNVLLSLRAGDRGPLAVGVKAA